MIVEQAVFGEVSDGHGLKAATDGTAGALAARLDLPDTAPLGVSWSPFLIGFPHRDRYVLARTFPDPAASRAGMVLSHALIAPLEQIVVTADLRPLFAQLITEPIAPVGLQTLDLTPGDALPLQASDLPATATALATRDTRPAVRLGIDGFEDLIVSLWARLWPALRRSFAFRLSFSPADIVETPQPALVCTPAQLESRWHGYRLVTAQSTAPASPAAVLLCGLAEGKPLRMFATEMAVEPASFTELALLESAYLLATADSVNVEDTLAAVRLIDRLSPDPARGVTGKANLINRLVAHWDQASAADALSLRNLDLAAFEESERVWSALSQWLSENTFPPAHDAAFRDMIIDTVPGVGSGQRWRNAVVTGLSAAAASGDFGRAFWRWAETDPSLVRPLWAAIGAPDVDQDVFVGTAPARLPIETAQEILHFAREEHLYRLHGAAAASAFEPGEAARLQVAAEPPSGAEGIGLALSHATPQQIVNCAIVLRDRRIISLAAEAVALDPDLVAHLDLSDQSAQAIWAAALARNPEAWRGPADPRLVFDTILVDLLEGREALPELLTQLSATPLADLIDFSRRAELWPRLGSAAQAGILRTTARAWLSLSPDRRSPIEPELQAAVLAEPELDRLLTELASGSVGHAVHIVTMLVDFDEQRFVTWFRIAAVRSRPLPDTDSTAIGHLAQQRGWRSVADALVAMLRDGRHDTRPALRACVSLVSRWDRWRHRLAEISTDEKWASFEALAADLYPTGPHQDGLWERSGGRDADLTRAGSGRDQWRAALSKIRHGGSNPHLSNLVHQMRDDYPGNPAIGVVADDPEFGGHR